MQTAAIYKIFCSDDINIALIGLNWRKMPSFVVCQNGKNMCSGKWKMHDWNFDIVFALQKPPKMFPKISV